jgi:hypothetical protein
MQLDLPVLRIALYSALVRGYLFFSLNKGLMDFLDFLQLHPLLPLRREAELHNPPSIERQIERWQAFLWCVPTDPRSISVITGYIYFRPHRRRDTHNDSHDHPLVDIHVHFFFRCSPPLCNPRRTDLTVFSSPLVCGQYTNVTKIDICPHSVGRLSGFPFCGYSG